MPCGDSAYQGRVETIIRRIPDEESIKLLHKLRKEHDEVVQFLCYMIGQAKENDTFNKLPAALIEWSINHDKMDIERLNQGISEMIETGVKDPFEIASKLSVDAKKVHPLSAHHMKLFLELAMENLGIK